MACSFLGSPGNEQSSGCNLPHFLPVTLRLMHGFACAFPGKTERKEVQHNDEVELPKQSLGTLFQGKLKSPLGFSYRIKLGFESPSSRGKLNCRAF